MRQIDLKSQYDLVIVGGGIQGCALLWEAQSRGLSTLLVEAEDYCSQTSANSLKIIHGGIRYLQTLNLARTWRSSREPEILLKIAPHLIHPLACVLPTERRLKRSRLAVGAGFGFYNLIKHFSCPHRQLPKACCLSKKQLRSITEILDHDRVTGAGMWHDAQVQNAERLGLAFVKSAQLAGGQAYNYLKADSISKTPDNGLELSLTDSFADKYYSVCAGSVVYCTASDTAKNLAALTADPGTYPGFCLAVNLVIAQAYSNLAIGLQSGFNRREPGDSGRLLFAAPWQNSTLLGTWYFKHTPGSREMPAPNEQQISFCLEDVNQSYPGFKFSRHDICFVHAGLLPLNGKNANLEQDLMEHDLVIQPDPELNVFGVIPTKYTTCRATAERVITGLAQKLNKTLKPSISAVTPLMGGWIQTDFETYKYDCRHKYANEFSPQVIDRLALTYGDQIDEIADMCIKNNTLSQLIPGCDSHIKAQLDYELEHTQVCKLSDFILRRIAPANRKPLNRRALEYCCRRINEFHHSTADRETQIQDLLKHPLYFP